MTLRDLTATRLRDACVAVLLLGLASCAAAPGPRAATLRQDAGGDAAADDGWRWRVEPYVWAADLDGEITADGSTVDFDVPFHDTLDHLDEGGQLLVEAGTGRWSFLVDVTYLELSVDGTFQPGLGVVIPKQRAELTADLFVGAAGALARVSERSPLELGVGVRFLELDTEVHLGGAPSIREDPEFVDGVVMARHSWALGEDGTWRAGLYGDAGTGDSDFTWQGAATLNRVFDGWSLALGYRHLDYDIGGSHDADVTLSGFVLGANLVF